MRPWHRELDLVARVGGVDVTQGGSWRRRRRLHQRPLDRRASLIGASNHLVARAAGVAVGSCRGKVILENFSRFYNGG